MTLQKKMDEILTGLPLNEARQEEIGRLKDTFLNQSVRVAFLGRFSAGKSTLINALVGRPGLLPTKTTVTTALLTEIASGSRDRAVLRQLGGEQDIPVDAIGRYTQDAEWIGEIESMAITLQDSLLPTGVIILDTPGENSQHDKHYELAHRAIAGCDAAVFVIDKASLTQANLLYLQTIRQFQPNLIFVLNQIDRIVQAGEGERLIDIISRLEDELSVSLGMEATVYALSAKEGTGVDLFRTHLFQLLVNEVDRYKTNTAEFRLHRLLSDAAVDFSNEEKLFQAALSEGREGVERSKALLEKERTLVMQLIEKEKTKMLGEWKQIRSGLKDSLQQLNLQLKEDAIRQSQAVSDRDSSQAAGLTIQQTMLREKSMFVEGAMQSIRERCAKNFEIQTAEIAHSVQDLQVAVPDLSDLERRQQLSMASKLGELTKLKERYDALDSRAQAAGGQDSSPAELQEIEEQVIRIKQQLDAVYVPSYVAAEVGSPNAYKKLGKDIGKLVDWAMIVVPIAGQTTAAKKIAQEGLKGVTKEVLKQSVKEAAQNSAKQLMKPGQIIKQDPANPMLDMLNLASFEGIGEKIGAYLDDVYQSSRVEMVEDPEYRRTFFNQKQQLELEFLQKQRVLKQVKGTIQDQKLAESRQASEKAQLENLLRDKDIAIQQLEAKLKAEWERESLQKLRNSTKEVLFAFIDRETELLDAWIEAQSVLTQSSLTDGLQAYYNEQFDAIDTRIGELLEADSAREADILQKLVELRRSMQYCERMKGELAVGESVGMA